MSLIEWTDALSLGVKQMDATHREFVDLLNALGDAPDAELVKQFDLFYAHTVAHFEHEERWMAAIDFPATHCHAAEHAGVLEIMREVRGYLLDEQFHVGRVLASELAIWFQGHAATMDTLLAQFIRAKQFDPDASVAVADQRERL